MRKSTHCDSSVLFIERIVPAYRVPFFLAMYELLRRASIKLAVVGGACMPSEYLTNSLVELPFGHPIHNHYLFRSIYWQSGLLQLAKSSQLIITGQENRSLTTNMIVLRRRLTRRPPLIAFYDHGPVSAGSSLYSSLNYALKKSLSLRADWWFAYTELSKSRLIQAGYNQSRITVVNNAIDTLKLSEAVEKITPEELTSLYNKLFGENITSTDSVVIAISCTRLIAEKKIKALLTALDMIYATTSHFRMLVIGDGPMKSDLQNFCRSRSWCKYLGVLYGKERNQYFALADVWLNPGTVGLTVLDAFASSAPLFTTTSPSHGPEICYLEHNNNGVITTDDVTQYANSVTQVIQNPKELQRMQASARQSALHYSLDSMVNHFSSGIVKALSAG